MYIDFTKYFAWFRQFQGKKIVEKKKKNAKNTVWKLRKFTVTLNFFVKNFVKVTFLLKNY